MKTNKRFYVYILLCSDGTYYVGLTSDLTGRLESHNTAKYPNAYTATRRPFELVYFETFMTHAEASEREIQIKNWSKSKKEALIHCNEKDLKDLSKKSFQ